MHQSRVVRLASLSLVRRLGHSNGLCTPPRRPHPSRPRGTLSFAGEPPTPQASSAPSIEGTYRPISQKLADGTVLKPPDMMGLQTSTKRDRNCNILSKDADGQLTSLSIVSTSTLTSTEYADTPLFSMSVRGQEIRHDLSGQTQRSVVTMDAGRLPSHRPVEQRVTVFEGNGFTSTAANNAHVDTWEKVEYGEA
jgi:hypothetical protein